MAGVGRGAEKEKEKKDGNNTFSEVYDSLARDVTAQADMTEEQKVKNFSYFFGNGRDL